MIKLSKSLKWIFLLSLLLTGCSSNVEKSSEVKNEMVLENTNFSNTISGTSDRDNLPNTEAGGISLGLYNAGGNIETVSHFEIEENEKINKYLSIGNLINKDRIYKLILFVDYEQTNFSIDGRDKNSDFTFKMKAGETIEIPFEIDTLEKGLHDIIFVIAKYPDNVSLDEDFRKQTDLNNLLFMRFSTSVGNDDTVYNDLNFNKYGKIKTEDILDGIFVSNEKNDYKRWLTEDISKSKKELTYYTHIGNVSGEEKTYALLNLFDWEQTKIIDNKNVTFHKLKNNQVVTLKTNLEINNKKGVYDMVPILVHNPFQKLDMYNQGVETSIRTGINIE